MKFFYKKIECLLLYLLYTLRIIFWCIWCHSVSIHVLTLTVSTLGIFPHLKARLPKLCNWLHGITLSAFWRQPDMASGYPSSEQIDAMSGIVFDAMSGVKNLVKFIPAINCTTSANESSFIIHTMLNMKKQQKQWIVAMWFDYRIDY